MNLAYRIARPEDSELVYQIKKEALGPYVAQTWGWDETWQRAYHAKHFKSEDVELIVHDGEVVGWREVRHPPGEIRLNEIYLAAAWQRRGVGSAVLAELVAESEAAGWPIRLQVLKVNEGARRLYERHGFVLEEEKERHFAMVRWPKGGAEGATVRGRPQTDNGDGAGTELVYRVATLEDVPALEALIPLSTRALQAAYYSSAQIEAALGTVFGVDTQLIRDRTYFVAVASDGRIAGCGGWSKRRTLYGGDRGKTGEDPLRDPRTEPAMIRAFFVHPDFARGGIGRRFLQLCEEALAREGFGEIDIVATLAGEPLYTACGYAVRERYDIPLPGGGRMPVVRMGKRAA